jgi:hypothetical protein
MGSANSAAATAAQIQYAHALSSLSVAGTRGSAKSGSTGSPLAVVSSAVVVSSTSNAKNARATLVSPRPDRPAFWIHETVVEASVSDREPRVKRFSPNCRAPRAVTRDVDVLGARRYEWYAAAAVDRTAPGASLAPARCA